MRADFRGESVDEAIMNFIHNRTKSATPDEYLLSPDFEFVHLFFQFYVLSTSGARLTIQNGALFRSENLSISFFSMVTTQYVP